MTGIDLKELNLQKTIVSHPASDSFEGWIATLRSKSSESLVATKTLVLKPSSKAKKQEPLIIVAGHETPLALGSLTKSLGSKDARMAADDYVSNLFPGVAKMDGNFDDSLMDQ